LGTLRVEDKLVKIALAAEGHRCTGPADGVVSGAYKFDAGDFRSGLVKSRAQGR
jgi:hypothetical protein